MKPVCCVCSSLLNHAVPNTVDMRALSPSQDPDSKESNMMLALESARAIGCRIGDNTTQMIDRGEPQAVRQLFMDIVRVLINCFCFVLSSIITGTCSSLTSDGR